ncbi:outer membrane protein assembly factor BamD [Flavobacteriaceae bacterium]|jgi:outer membrane protein assembly factor BamD|nr:outer membrane protein assembly factor BamD [Flavobacteriaceae bacterium]|tara:strand:- start:14380 stop:15207 length:828 start_codon:yes stop_codon:yes gene_type:complete
MKLKLVSVSLFSFFLGALFSCSDYQKLLNSDNASEKYKQAEVFYNSGEYRKANRLLEQIIPKYRGKPQAQRIIFFFAESYFQIKSYNLAAYQYENFVKSFPKSDRIQEASFKAAKSYYYQSPTFSLDQEETYTAIEKLQVFINLYPNSEYSSEANQMISELQVKLEKKDFEIAKQYYTIRDYRAAIKTNDNFIASFPGTKFREEALFTKFISLYEIAINSVIYKKEDRLKELQQQFNLILRYYPDSVFKEDLDDKMKKINSELEKFNTTTANLIK